MILKCIKACFTCADTDYILDITDEDLARIKAFVCGDLRKKEEEIPDKFYEHLVYIEKFSGLICDTGLSEDDGCEDDTEKRQDTGSENTVPDEIKELAIRVHAFLDALRDLRRRAVYMPVHELSMMMSIALRFIPILLEETDKIMKAQQARGADFETGGVFRRVRAMIPLLVPLFVSAFRRANDLAMAMEARCYRGGEGRTQMKPLRYEKRDYLTYLVLLVYLTAAIVLRIVMHW